MPSGLLSALRGWLPRWRRAGSGMSRLDRRVRKALLSLRLREARSLIEAAGPGYVAPGPVRDTAERMLSEPAVPVQALIDLLDLLQLLGVRSPGADLLRAAAESRVAPHVAERTDLLLRLGLLQNARRLTPRESPDQADLLEDAMEDACTGTGHRSYIDGAWDALAGGARLHAADIDRLRLASEDHRNGPCRRGDLAELLHAAELVYSDAPLADVMVEYYVWNRRLMHAISAWEVQAALRIVTSPPSRCCPGAGASDRAMRLLYDVMDQVADVLDDERPCTTESLGDRLRWERLHWLMRPNARA